VTGRPARVDMTSMEASRRDRRDTIATVMTKQRVR